MKRRNATQRDFINGLLFSSPWILGFLAFSVYPLLSSLYYSLTKFNAVTTPQWVGLNNFKDIFADPLVWKSLGNTLFMAFISTPINLCVALLLASIVCIRFKGRGIVRTAFFLPSVIPMVAATMVWIWMFDPTYGYINNVLSWVGISGPSWLMDANYTKWALVLMGTWNTGTMMLVCMSALQSVPKSYYEALVLARDTNSVIQFDEISMTPFFYYYRIGFGEVEQHIVWSIDARTINALSQIVKDYDLAGTGIWNVMVYYAQLWLVLRAQFDIIKLLPEESTE